MHNQPASEQSINFYLEELCPRADEVFRMAYMLTLNLDKAQHCLERAFELLCEAINDMQRSERIAYELVRLCWHSFQQLKLSSASADSPLAESLEALVLEERASLAAVDLMGLAAGDAMAVFNWDLNTFRTHLGKARKKLSDIQIEALEGNRKRNVSS